MRYTEAIEFLYGLRLFGTKLGLENTFALAELCGNPQEKLRFIHVAGTNGKGSVCAMLESIYRGAGLRVGLFTSPHLVSFTERIQVDRALLPEQAVARLVEQMIALLGGRRENWTFRPTFFEFVAILGLLYFVEERCELVVWETGMGGRLDATNIVTPLASVITNVQLDHQQWLGSTVAEIAQEKGGIIKAGIPVITGAQPGDALDILQRRALELRCPFTSVLPLISSVPAESVSLLGKHQRLNAAVAVATVEALQNVIPVSSDLVLRGLANTSWPGRLQRFQLGTSTLLVDGAHNPDGARTLASALRELFPDRECTLVLGLFKDKKWEEMCDILVPGSRRIFLVPIQSERSVDVNELLAYCSRHWPSVEVHTARSSAQAVDEALRFPFVVVAGSLHLVGEVMEHLSLVPGRPSERGLNEWQAAGHGAR